jgi:hypothetical protein
VVFDESVLANISKPSGIKTLGSYQPKGKETKLKIYSVDYPYTQRKISAAELKQAIRSLKS